MIDLSRELLQCMAIAWTCFAAGIWILSCYRQVMDLQWLGKGLVLMCPAILSAFSSHSVRVCEQVILSKQNQSEAVNERIYLASVTTAEFGDGYSLTTERYSDGTTRTAGQMPATGRRGAWGDGRHEASHDEAQRDAGSLVPLSSWRGVTW
jgi:hypothetical protein